MEIVVLGGSAAGGNTGAGCAGFLVRSEQTSIVLDLGPGTLLELRKHTDYRSLDGIVISHNHLDHILDLFSLRFLLKYNPVKPAKRIPLWMPPNGREMLARVAVALEHDPDEGPFFDSVFDIDNYDPNSTIGIGNLTVRFAPTVHYIPCWAMRVSNGSSSEDLVYTGDTGPAARLDTFANDAAVLIAEATLPGPGNEPPEVRGHQTAIEAAHLATTANIDVLVLTHMWEEYGFDSYLANAQSVFGGIVELARPGVTITWPLTAQ